MIFDIFTPLLIAVSFAAFAARRLLTYLHAFQQEEYDNGRFAAWMIEHKVFDRKMSAIIFISGVLWFLVPRFVVDLLVLFGFAVLTYAERDPRKESKKKLAMTERAKRIYFIALGVSVVPALLSFATDMPWFWIALVQLLPAWLVLANTVLQPYEDSVQKRFRDEAQEKITRLNPTVIGVTGSFGKTSVKHILGHILNMHAPTLVTPGSVNTPMGIARIVREQLDETHKYMISEMGAYGPGSIERLCALTPPHFGIITAVGHAHYERFKSLETVAEAKFELARAVFAKNGRVVAHEKTFKFEASGKMYQDHPQGFVVCGTENKSGLRIKSIQQTTSGLEVGISWNGAAHILQVPLYGAHHGENVAMAYAMACTLGIDPERVASALKSCPQIPHRLEVKKSSTGGFIIDDAFNSNPAGFSSALELLDFLGTRKRKILITPGMVELGAAHDEVHRQIGANAAGKCDVCIVIQPGRVPTFIEGFKSKGGSATLMEMKTFAEAQHWLAQNMTEKDVVLLENDLPDVYERVPKL